MARQFFFGPLLKKFAHPWCRAVMSKLRPAGQMRAA